MRKFLASFVLFMLFSMFSGAVFAEKFDVCEDIKHDPAYKGLYGLCNAYWNADSDEARDSILKAFKKKADPLGLTMPGLDSFACPCWSNLTKDEICEMGDALLFSDGGDGFLILSVPGSSVSNWLTAFSSVGYCAHDMFEGDEGKVNLDEIFDLSPAEAIGCIEDLEEMAMVDFCDL